MACLVLGSGQDRADLGSLSVPNNLSEELPADLKARGHLVSLGRGAAGGVALIDIDKRLLGTHAELHVVADNLRLSTTHFIAEPHAAFP